MSINRKIRRAKLEAMSFRREIAEIARDIDIDVFGLSKNEAIDLILKTEERAIADRERERKENETIARLKQAESDLLQYQKKLKKISKKSSGLSHEVRARLSYQIKVAGTTGVLDLADPLYSKNVSRDCFRFEFEQFPTVICDVYGRESNGTSEGIVQRKETKVGAAAVPRRRKKKKNKDASLRSRASKKKFDKDIRSLWLTNNRIRTLPDSVALLQHSLIELGLEGNRLESIDTCIFSLERLERLHLSRNKISHIPAEISQLKRLKELDVAENALTKLSADVCRLRGLYRLDLSRNRIADISSSVIKLTCLVEMNLSDNALSKLPSQLEALSGSLKILRLEGNPIKPENDSCTQHVLNSLRDNALALSIDSWGSLSKKESALMRSAAAEWVDESKVAVELRAMLRNRHASRELGRRKRSAARPRED